MGVLGISYYDPYSGIIITNDCIDVTHGHWPFDMNQKFSRGIKKFRVTGIDWEPHKDKLIKRFIFDYVDKDENGEEFKTGESFRIDAIQVLKSLKEGRTKFSL